MRNAEAIRKEETTVNATKNIAKMITAIVMLLATVAVVYMAS